MEVHHHSHSARKKWAQLFLGVSHVAPRRLLKEFIRAPHESPVLRTADPEIVKDFTFMLEMDKENTILFTNVLRKYKKEAEALLGLLEKEYHIK